MSNMALESVLRRDRIVVAAALVTIAGLAWICLVRLGASTDMGGAGMATSLDPLVAPTRKPWSRNEAALTFAMWTVMMVGMMTPSAAPMILLYARVGRQAAIQNRPFAATGWFASGYVLVWTGFALAATGAQWALDLLTPSMAGTGRALGGVLLITTAIYQWTALKDACLSRCQSPLVFIQRHGGFRRDLSGSLQLGMRHGAYCVGCCWALMLLLFVGGTMNLLWVAAIAMLVLAEKLTPAGWSISRIAGVGFGAVGVWLLATA